VSNITRFHGQRVAVALLFTWVLASCGGSDDKAAAPVSVPNVVGQTQAAATASITGVGLTVGTVSQASSSTVASGSVISETPAASSSVTAGSAVNLTVSSGAAQVAVPNVVGSTQAAASTSITGAGLVVGTVTTASSSTVASGSVISESPAAATSVNTGSAVNLTVSSGPAAASGSFGYVSNATSSNISAYSINSTTGALTPLAGSPFAVPGSTQLFEAKIDPSGKFLYVADDNDPGQIFAFSINQTSGALTAVSGSPFAAGNGSQSIAFDTAGAHLYVANFDDNSISAYALNASTGVLTPITNSPFTVSGTNPQPSQLASSGNHLFVADFGANSVDVFTIAASTGQLTEGVAGSPFATGTAPYALVANATGSLLYVANAGQTATSISAFTISASSGVLTPVAGNPVAIAILGDMAIDPQGKFLITSEFSGAGVYPINATTGALGAGVAGSPFATSTNQSAALPFSVGIDPTGTFVYVCNDGGSGSSPGVASASAGVAEFTLNDSTGVLTPVVGSPVVAGANPDFIAIK
jgi:6-phosphogluconolactonase